MTSFASTSQNHNSGNFLAILKLLSQTNETLPEMLCISHQKSKTISQTL